MTAPQHPPLWAWMVQAADGRWGVIGAIIPRMGNAQLVAGSEETIRLLRPFAEAHHRASGDPVRLVRFAGAEVVESFGPTGRC